MRPTSVSRTAWLAVPPLSFWTAGHALASAAFTRATNCGSLAAWPAIKSVSGIGLLLCGDQGIANRVGARVGVVGGHGNGDGARQVFAGDKVRCCGQSDADLVDVRADRRHCDAGEE